MEHFHESGGVLEREPSYSSKIHLKFLRHDEKENDKSKSDDEVRLTEKGRLHAKGQTTIESLDQAVAFGSPRKRTQETAALVMSGMSPDIDGDESLEELKKKLDANRTYGSKIVVDGRLNFELDVKTPFGAKAFEAFKKGEYLRFVIEESDRIAAEMADTKGSTYSRQAANVARIIEKYLSIAPRFDNLVRDESKKITDTLERVLASHQGVLESFLAKIIEKTEGVDARDKFVKALKNQGFDFSEGFDVDIVTEEEGQAPRIRIAYHKMNNATGETFDFEREIPISAVHEISGE